MQKGSDHVAGRLLAATIVAMVLIAGSSLFLIAPFWQLPVPAAVYIPPDQTDVSEPVSTSVPALIDVNLADAETLQLLPGVGPAKAAAILAYREEYGPFSSLADLEEVSGISARMIESWSGLAVAGTDNT